MIVGLDSTPLTTPFGGIRRYVAELHRALAHQFPEDQFLLLSDQDGRPLSGLAKHWWLYGLPQALKQSKADLFHGTDFAVPYRKALPAVMTLHDLSPWRFPQQTSPRVARRTPWLLKLGLAGAVITPSQAVRQEAIARFNLPPDRVHAIPLGAGREFRPSPTTPSPATPSPTTPSQTTPRLGLASDGRIQQPYFLAVGMAAGRKNFATIAAAHAALPNQTELVVTGIHRPNHGLTRYLDIPDADLPTLYSNATALLYPSLYEGFGLPLLEAMACGTPVIASTDPALTETTGGAALHLPPNDVRAWTEAMQALLTQPERAATLRAAGLKRAALFPWSKTAQLTREVYANVLRRSS